MALSASTIIEVQTGGSDTSNGGAFDPSQTAGMFTDGAATSANTSAPVFSSASYNFVAGDVGAWVYIASGTNWTAGWYKISSVASNVATLNGTIGQAVTRNNMIPSTVAGCATVASPTSATWTIDYSQQSSAQFSYTDLASSGTGLTVSSSAKPFAKQHVGNSIVVTGGTNFNTGRYVIASVAAAVATVVGPTNITTGAGSAGTGGMGGAVASPGTASSFHVSLNLIFVQSGSYSITSATASVSGGCISLVAGSGNGATQLVGYGSVRNDYGTRPTLTASGVSTFNVVTLGAVSEVRNVNINCASLISSRAIHTASNVSTVSSFCKVSNCTNRGVVAFRSYFCEVTGCSGAEALGAGYTFGNYVHDNTCTGIVCDSAFSATSVHLFNRCVNNTGASSDGIGTASIAGVVSNNTCYGNGRDGIRLDAFSIVQNNICVNNTGLGINPQGSPSNQPSGYVANNATYNNTGGSISTTANKQVQFGNIALSGDPFINAAAGNFGLNNTAGAGASCRAAAIPGASYDGLVTAYLDMGAAQHQDSGGIISALAMRGGFVNG